jgi:hypothetical protein
MTSSEGPATTCINFACLLLMAHAIPAAAIKQSAPPTVVPITMVGLVLVLVESLTELELRYTKLVWLGTVLVRAVPPSNHGQESSRMQGSEKLRIFDLSIYCLVFLNFNPPLFCIFNSLILTCTELTEASDLMIKWEHCRYLLRWLPAAQLPLNLLLPF